MPRPKPPIARPPSSSASVRSHGSARSASSRRSLQHNLAQGRLTTLVQIKAQMEAKQRGQSLGPKARMRLHRAAKQQAVALLGQALVDEEQLPSKPGPGDFRPGALPPAVAEAIAEAASECVAAAAAAATPIPEGAPQPPPAAAAKPTPPPTPRSSAAESEVRKRRLPNINVSGKLLPLETLIQDKVQQYGQGGAHQLRKMFQAFDVDGTGLITVQEFDRFLKLNNIKMSRGTLENFFEMWAGEKTREDLQIHGIDDDDVSTPIAPACRCSSCSCSCSSFCSSFSSFLVVSACSCSCSATAEVCAPSVCLSPAPCGRLATLLPQPGLPSHPAPSPAAARG